MIRILVVDDDESIREIVKIMLKDHEVIEATNGLEGVKIYESIKPEVVLMDINMPGMDGVEATKQILEIDPNAIVIGLTAFARSRGKELLEVGAKGIIEKPFTRKSLRELIEPFIAKTVI
ncbi:MAG: response regulator [Archaeoglobales archaeon]|nr:response regulator [Archaeoglobales archaeon]MDI9642744.1 response regulator [Archaeoglobales archaeon]